MAVTMSVIWTGMVVLSVLCGLATGRGEAVAAAAKDGEPFASRVRRERLSIDHMMLLHYDILKNASAKLGYKWTRPETKAEAVENWIRDVKSFNVKARRETTSAKEIETYFERLRKEAR